MHKLCFSLLSVLYDSLVVLHRMSDKENGKYWTLRVNKADIEAHKSSHQDVFCLFHIPNYVSEIFG